MTISPRSDESYECPIDACPHSLCAPTAYARTSLRICVRRWVIESRIAGHAIRSFERVTRPLLPVRLEEVAKREDLPRLLNSLGLRGCGAEVGVQQGVFSAHILRHWTGRLLVSVDPWTEDDTDAYRDAANVTQSTHEAFLAQTRRRLGAFGRRSAIWRMTSREGSTLLTGSSLDFVYLDGRHDEASVTEDLELWWDKVRPGGVIAGHDYLDGHLPGGVFGVRTAVDRFFGERQLPIHTTTEDAPWISWIVRKLAFTSSPLRLPSR